MFSKLIRPVGLATVLTLALTSTALPGGRSVSPNQPIFVPPLPPLLPVAPLAPEGTSGIITEAEEIEVRTATRAFSEAQVLCLRLPDRSYQIDCLSDRLSQLAADLPNTPDFAEAQAIVRDTAQKLNRVARRNASSTKRPAILREATGPDPKRSTRPIIPVEIARLDAANTLATQILREAETQLLRAAEQSERRRVAYTEIATAVGSSSLILLRAQ